MTTMVDDGDLELGSGARVRLLEGMDPTYADALDVVRSNECEARVEALPERLRQGKRMQYTLPPYMKWPIWRARPASRKGGDAPTTCKALAQRLEALPASGKVVPETVPTLRVRLPTTPRVGLEVRYCRGELSRFDRRVFVALTHHAIVSVGAHSRRGGKAKGIGKELPDMLRDGPKKRRDVPLPRNGWKLEMAELMRLLGLKPDPKNRALVVNSLWRMADTTIQLTTADQLVNRWGARGTFLLPELSLARSGRRYEVSFDLPKAARRLISTRKITTVDTHRMRGIKAHAAESLYLLLYDLSQWADIREWTYSATELTERLGLNTYCHYTSGKRYTHQGNIERVLDSALSQVGQCAGFVRDWEKLKPCKERKASRVAKELRYTFSLVPKGICHLHLPRSQLSASLPVGL